MMRHPVLITMLASVLAGPALAQAKTPTTAPMLMPQNAAQIELVAVLGRGDIKDVAYSPTGQSMAVAGSAGIWLYDTTDLRQAPRFLAGQTFSIFNFATVNVSQGETLAFSDIPYISDAIDFLGDVTGLHGKSPCRIISDFLRDLGL